MFMVKRYFILFSLLVFTLVAMAQDIKEVPQLWARVTDQTNTLTTSDIQNLDNYLENLEREKGSQIAVLIISTTEPEPIEDYAIRVAEQWKIGRKGVDDGVILIVAKEDRKLRIEVGYGLEGAITDLQAKRIIENYITPAFKQGDFAGGINEGVSALAALIQGEELPEPTGYANNEDSGGDGWFIFLIILGFIISGAASSKVGKWKSRGIGGVVIFVLGIIFMNLAAAFALLFFFSIFSLIMAGSSGRGGGHWGGGYSGGGGFSSGGGFSGGGGSFGGGGASGSW